VSGVLTTRKWRSYYPILIFSSLREAKKKPVDYAEKSLQSPRDDGMPCPWQEAMKLLARERA
jgi:hypothetical protein